ncbi:hypothetical protein BH10PSE15_BH10PSE15_16750 [soil metagenome]
MKNTFKIAAALGLMVTGLGISTGASAQGYDRDHRGYDRRDDRDGRRDWHHDRGEWRGDHRDWREERRGYYGYNRGYGYGHAWGHNRDCRTTWRHHRRVTVCYR